MLVGYCRVSTNDQNLDSQIDLLKKAGCTKIFKDIVSGSKAERVGLAEMIDYVREGDIVVVYRLDRLARGLIDLLELMEKFKNKNIGFRSISENLDTTTPTGKLMFHITGAFAEFERNIIRERTRAGLESARARGRKGGRPSLITPEKIQMAKTLHANTKLAIPDILKTMGVTRALFYKMLSIGKNNKPVA